MAKPHRIQLDYSPDYVATLDALQAEMGLETRKDLFNTALTLLQWAAKTKRNGLAVGGLDKATGRAIELIMPGLENIEPKNS